MNGMGSVKMKTQKMSKERERERRLRWEWECMLGVVDWERMFG